MVTMNYIAKGHPKAKVLRFMELQRSSYYYGSCARKTLSKPGRPHSTSTIKLVYLHNSRTLLEEIPNDEVIQEIKKELSQEFLSYGYIKMTYLLKRKGYLINKKKVYRLMKEAHLLNPKTNRSKEGIFRVKEKKPKLTSPNQLWEMDIKYMPIHGEGRYAYLVTLLDCYTREAINYHVGYHCQHKDIIRIVEEALSLRRLEEYPCILRVRNDNGSQFISRLVREALRELGILQEFSHLGKPIENAHIRHFTL